MRDPFKNPFPASDEARHSIWEMLVHRDIDAFLAADWSKVAEDFVQDGFPTLSAYRDEWLRQAEDFKKQSFSEDPRTAIFTTTVLEDIEINADMALVRKKFDGSILRADGLRDRMLWQTLYYCRKHQGRWKISGFTGYLPNPMA